MVSIDIINFLKQKGYSDNEIAQMIGTSTSFINDIFEKKSTLSEEHLIAIKNKTNTSLTQLIIEAVPEKHLPNNFKKRLEDRAKIIRDLKSIIHKRK